MLGWQRRSLVRHIDLLDLAFHSRTHRARACRRASSAGLGAAWSFDDLVGMGAEVMPICNTKNEFVFGGLNAQCGRSAPVGLRDRGAGVLAIVIAVCSDSRHPISRATSFGTS